MIKEQGSLESVLSMKGYIHSLFKTKHEEKGTTKEEAPLLENHIHTSTTHPAQGSDQDLGSSAAAYLYYFQAVGWLNILVFVCGAVSFVFFFKFSGTSSRKSYRYRSLLTMIRSLAPMVGGSQRLSAKPTLLVLEFHLCGI